MLKQKRTEIVLIIEVKPLAYVHSDDNHRDGARDAEVVVLDGVVVGRRDVIRASSREVAANLVLVGIFAFQQALDGHCGGTALRVAHQVDGAILGRAADFAQIWVHGQQHIHHVPCGKVCAEIRVGEMGGGSESYVVRHYQGIAVGGEDAFQLEGV